jgi:hypothetical protein
MKGGFNSRRDRVGVSMDIWKGALLGDLAKHRDFEHASYGEHAMDNGAVERREEWRRVRLTKDPITVDLFDVAVLYFAVKVTLHDKEYTYYVPAGQGGNKPSEQDVIEAMNEYNENPDVYRGDLELYIEDEPEYDDDEEYED